MFGSDEGDVCAGSGGPSQAQKGRFCVRVVQEYSIVGTKQAYLYSEEDGI